MCCDFRQVLNILQLQHTLKLTLEGEKYSPINEDDVSKYLGIPSQTEFNHIIEALLNKRLKQNVERLTDDHNNNKYSLVELIRLLTNWVVEQKLLTISKKKQLIESLAEVDYRLKNSMGESDIQIYALASIFMGVKSIIDKNSSTPQ